MSTKTIYSEILLEKVIRSILDDGLPLTLDTINSRYSLISAGKDLSQPTIDTSFIEILEKENASSSKFNNINNSILNDLNVSYKTLLDITNKSISNFDRWRNFSNKLESRLQNLNLRIDNLLKTQINKNSHYVSDNFVDMSMLNLNNTTALIDIKSNNIRLQSSSSSPSRINLNYVLDTDVVFSVLSTRDFKSLITAPDADVVNALNDQNNFWQSRVSMQSSDQAVTTELKIKLFDSPTRITKINIILHSSNTNSPIQITPLTSSDGINFAQLDVQNVTTSVSVNAFWLFAPISITHIKFIMTKSAPDFFDNQSFVYEFGAQEISFFDIGFDNTTQIFQTQALFAPDISNNPINFSSIELETCELLPNNTNIIYSVAASNSPDNTILQWSNIDPVNRSNALFPKKINLSISKNFNISNIGISYDANGQPGAINPSENYKLLRTNSNNKIITNNIVSANIRYIFTNSNERILDYELDTLLNLRLDTLTVYRNVGFKGDKKLVRNIQRGWTFDDPFYKTVVLVNSPVGLSIDVGDNSIIIDGQPKHGSILLSQGNHDIFIHKDKWLDIESNLTTLQNLKNQDRYYPFNQKLLIEGYSIPGSIIPYIGVDLFAGYQLNAIPIADFTTIIDANDYSVYSLDKDKSDGESKFSSSYVFVIKSNESNSDFLNELFNISFDINNNLYKYVYLKGELSSLDSNISPVLTSYTLKMNE